MQKELPPYKGFVISYQDPPATGVGWELNIAGTTPELMALLRTAKGGEHGSATIVAPTFEEAKSQAIAFIDQILGDL